MAFNDSIKVIQSSDRRLKIFVDYWNTVVSAQSMCSYDIEINWSRLADTLVSETRGGNYTDESRGSLAGCYIFGSFSRSDPRQKKSIDKVQDDYGHQAGLFFDFKERVVKETAHKCKNCNEPVQRSSEAGVDISLTVEMIKHASMREHDYLALISSDQDFVPLLQYLKDSGQRVLHAAPGHAHREMRNVSWKQISLKEYFPSLCRITDSKTYIFHCPGTEDKLQSAREILKKDGRDFLEIDISDKNQISDRDLLFLMSNQNIGIKFDKADDGEWFARKRPFSERLYEFRKDLYDRKIVDGLPYIMHNGQMEAHADQRWTWIRGSTEKSYLWKEHQEGDHVSFS